MNMRVPAGWEVRYIQGQGWCPANRHNTAVLRAINWGAHAMVFMGADHYVDEDCFVKLVGHLDDGWDMATAWVPSRGVVGVEKKAFPHLAYKKRNEDVPFKTDIPILQYNPEEWEIITTGAESQEIHVIGTGILMFKIDVVRDMKRPFFKEFVLRGDSEFNRAPVQDSYFTFRCTLENGHSLWLDTTINAYHLDVFPIDDTYGGRFYGGRFRDKEGEIWTPTMYLGISDEERGNYNEQTIAEPIRSDLQ
ncbi:MAG: hypothetical protein ACW99J_19780 [Candidatus Thorarchaeota archaeon]